MPQSITHGKSHTAFERALRRGRRDTSVISRLSGHDNRLVSLSSVLEAASAGNESYIGIREIPVDSIVGSENRADDFSRGFHPRKRWIGERWVHIHHLMSQGSLNDAVSVFEVGGAYFVRDGHHRVSAAKALGLAFMTAEVRSYPLPYSLPDGMDRNMLPLLRAKDRLHQRTGIFDVVSDRDFHVACASTWDWLEVEINEYNRRYFERRAGRPPSSPREQIKPWYRSLYRNAIDYIRDNSLLYLFPGKRETDIFIDIIRYFNSYDDPDKMSVGEIYELFVSKRQKQTPLLTLAHMLARWFRMMLMSPEEEYRSFIRAGQIDRLIDGFVRMPQEKGVYRYLQTQLIHCAAPLLKQSYGRAPYIQELTPVWYERFYAPMARAAMQHSPKPAAQFRYYKRMSRRYFRQVITGELTAEEAQRLTIGSP